MPMGFEGFAYARSTILEDCIKDVGEAFQSPPLARMPEPGAVVAPACKNHEQCPMFPSGPTDGTNRKDYCCFSQRYEHPSYLQRLMDESSRKKNSPYEDLEYSYVAFRRGIDHRTDTKNKINPKIDDFGITPFDSEPDAPIQN
ncbi:unnamed protein product, partial [Tuber aestivum]